MLRNAIFPVDVWEVALPSCRVRLQDLIFLLSCRTTDKDVVVDDSEFSALRCSGGMNATRPVFLKKEKKTVFKVFRARTTFVGLGSFLNIHTVE